MRRTLFFAALVLAGTSCSLNVDVNSPSVVVRTGGDNQTAATNTQLPQPLTVVVTDQFGETLSNIVVTWTIQSGGGSLSETSNTTGDGGVSSVTYTTGPTPGTATIQARVSGIPPVTFTETIT